MVLSASGGKRDARTHYEQAVALDPARARFHTCYARFLLDVHHTSLSPKRDLERSWLESDAALQIDPSDVDAHLVRARILHLERRFAEAEASAREALEVEPNLARAHEVLGDIYFAWHKSAEAFQCLREALRLNPFNRWLKRKVIRSLQDELPILGAVWRLARHRTRVSRLFWLLYVLFVLLAGLVYALLRTERAATMFQFALYVPTILMVLFYAILMGIDLAITLCVTSGWIKI
jgi:tetratricopeptide (TPR) repeat protein